MNTIRIISGFIVVTLCCGMQAAVAPAPKSASNPKTTKPVPTQPTPLAQEGKISEPSRQASAGNQSIYGVDIKKVFQDLDQVKDEESRLINEYNGRKKVVDDSIAKYKKLQEELQTMGTTAKASVRESKMEEMRELQETIKVKMQNIEEHRAKAVAETEASLIEKISEEAEEIRQERGIGMVLAGGILAIDPAKDLSSEVSTRMNKKYAAKKERQAPARVTT
jgi:Skp family chaperone for outer membrane proteins